jgi:hypothetical protein
MPADIDSSLIGKVVVLQVIPRKDNADGQLDMDRMEKFVGLLEAYSITRNAFIFRIKGFDLMTYPSSRYIFEFYVDELAFDK